MKRTNLILGVLALVLAIPTWLTLRDDRTIFVSLDDVPALFEGFTAANVAVVDVAVPQRGEDGAAVRDDNGNLQFDSVRLQRVDQDDEAAWILSGDTPLAGVPVRYEMVRDLILEPLGEVQLGDEAIVRRDAAPDDLRRFGLADDQATRIRCYGAANPPPIVAELLLGSDASGGQVGEDAVRGYFVRAADSNDVVLHERVYWLLSVEPNAWIDRKAFTLPVDEAVEVVLCNRDTRAQDRYPDDRCVVARASATAPDWERREGAEDRGAVRNTEIHGFLRSLSSLTVEQFLEPLPGAGPELDALLGRYGLARPQTWVEVALADGTRLRVEVGNEVPGQNQYYVRLSTIPFVVTAGEWVLSALVRDPTDWFEPR